jgi:hypothetical protein
MSICRAILVLCLLFVPTVAAADCVYNGKTYPEGTRIGVLVCESGRWVGK